MTQTPDDANLPAVRIGDAERNTAVDALGQHLSAGRLTLDEFTERSGAASAATTSAELVALFHDLPAPRPLGYPTAAPGAAPQPVRSSSEAGRTTQAQKYFRAIGAVLPILCTLLFALSGWDWWWVYLLLPIYYTAGGIITNRDDDGELGGGERRQLPS